MIPMDILFAYLAVLSFLFGACIGSFLNVCIYRIPIELSVVSPPSHCFQCKTPVRWYDNVPLVSYVVLRGSCLHCHASYSARYVLVELLTAVLFLLVWFLFAGDAGQVVLDPRIPVYWLVISGLIMGTFVDFDHLIIPDRVSIGGMIAGVLCSLLVPSLHGVDTAAAAGIQSLIGLAVGFGGLWLVARIGSMVFKQEAMGFGDVKLLGGIGAFFGWEAVLFTVLISSFVGSIVGVGIIVAKGREWQSRIPYGPYLALGAVVWMLWGHEWWKMYLALLSGPGAGA